TPASALFTRTRLSRTAASARPTSSKVGIPRSACTSTRTGNDVIPTSTALSAIASMTSAIATCMPSPCANDSRAFDEPHPGPGQGWPARGPTEQDKTSLTRQSLVPGHASLLEAKREKERERAAFHHGVLPRSPTPTQGDDTEGAGANADDSALPAEAADRAAGPLWPRQAARARNSSRSMSRPIPNCGETRRGHERRPRPDRRRHVRPALRRGHELVIVNTRKAELPRPGCVLHERRRDGPTCANVATALAFLVCRSTRLASFDLAQSWAGDPVVLLRRDAEDSHEAELAADACATCEDVSLRAVAMLARADDDHVDALVTRAAADDRELILCGNVVRAVGFATIAAGLEERLGRGWMERYHGALTTVGASAWAAT
ncbi:MAG: hypothetical protein K0S65_5354, partial [Labilithrix sp.]|nr:hypothetical protein [Labilithrix sp.]